MVLQFGVVWSLTVLLSCVYFFSGESDFAITNRDSFIKDLKSIPWYGYALVLVSVFVAVAGFAFVLEYFNNSNTGISKFVPLRTALAVVVLALVGLLFFKEKINSIVLAGLIVLFVGFIIMFIGRFLTS